VRSGKNLAIIFLLVTTLTGSTIAWIQHRELIELRASIADTDQLAAQPKTTAPIEVPSRDAPADIAVQSQDEPDPLPMRPQPFVQSRETGGDARRAQFRAMMDRPEVQRLMAIQQKSALDSRYAALFRNLSLTPDQLERFKELLVEKQTAASDVRSAAREQGMNGREDREALSKMVADTQAEIDENIRAALGENGFAQYENFEKTLPQRNLVNQLERRLSYSGTPLTNQQSEQMVAILASTPAGQTSGASGRPRDLRNPITDATINQARGVLAGPQIDALRQLQQEQQAQAALNAAMRARGQENDPASTLGQTPAATAVPAPRATTPPSDG
jgi:hypothetical protein